VQTDPLLLSKVNIRTRKRQGSEAFEVMRFHKDLRRTESFATGMFSNGLLQREFRQEEWGIGVVER
jgi:hypothetical protein